MTSLYSASVIIPTRNRSKLLKKCLLSLKQQSFPIDSFQVIVVDNASSDNTKQIALSFSNFINLKYCYLAELGLHAGRHEGMRQANSEILIYADDDIVAKFTWIEAIVNIFTDSSVAMVGGNNFPMFECIPPPWLLKWWNTPVYKGKAIGPLSILDFGKGQFEIDPMYIWGCNFSIKKEILIKAGGFHPDGMPTEKILYRGDGETHISDFVKKNNYKAFFDSKASVYHLVSRERMRKDYLLRRAYIQGISDSYTHFRASVNNKLYYDFRYCSRRIRDIFNKYKYKVNKNTETKELIELQESLRKSYWKGFLYHQAECRKDSKLMRWVLKRNYFI